MSTTSGASASAQTTSTAPATTPQTTGAPAPAPAAAKAAESSTTAARLRTLGIASVLACTLTGAAGYLVVESDPVQTARSTAMQTERLTRLHTSAQALHGDATTLLSSGAAATDTSSDYDASLSTLSREVAQAAAGRSEDAAQLGSVNAALTRYATTIERARMQAAAGSPTTELTEQAQALLTTDVTTPLAELRDSTAALGERASATATGFTVLLGLTTLISLGTLIGGGAWLARKTHRVVNPPLVAATLLTLGVSAVAASTVQQATAVAPDLGALGGLASLPFAGPTLLLGGLGAGALAWAGVSRRLREYR